VAQHFREQSKEFVAWAELAPVRDKALLVPILARALDIEMPPVESLMADLARLVKHRSILLVLDNAEHLAEAVADAATTLTAAGENLRLLVTSREPLHIQNERVYRLKGLEAPLHGADAPDALRAGAVALFVRCAGNTGVNFAAGQAVDDIAHICRRLDGLPLAIEMAAARVPALGAKGLRLGLEQHWRQLSSRLRDAPSRHETLEATLDWSYALLSSDEQRTLRRLALFVNGFSLDAARVVALEPGANDSDDWAVADLLAGLIDKSMVVAEPTEPPRYRLLETVRTYARDKLVAAGELSMIRPRVLDWLLDFFADADESAWTTPDRTWVANVRPELANLRPVVHDALADRNASDAAVQVVAAALLSWLRLGEAESEARALADRALALIGDGTARATEARLQFGRGLYYGSVDIHVSMQAFQRALHLAEGELGARDRAHILLEYARALTRAGDLPAAERSLRDATTLCGPLGIPTLNGLVSLVWAYLRDLQAGPAEAREHIENAVTQFDLASAGRLAAMARNDLANDLWAVGDLSAAESLFRKIVATAERDTTATSDRSGVPEMNLASVLAESGNVEQALMFARKAVQLSRRSERMWSAYDCLSLIAVLCGDYNLAAHLHGFSEATYARIGFGMREPNEARLHARVAQALREELDPMSLSRAIAFGRALDEDTACRMFLCLEQGPPRTATYR